LPGQPVPFAVSLNNSGNSDIANVTMTDTLPDGLTYVSGSLTASGGSAIYQAGIITWTGTVAANTTVRIEYDAASLPNASLGTVLTNTAVIAGGGDVFIRQAAVTLGLANLYLPLVARPLPGIQGHVTLDSAPAAGIFLELRRYNGQSFSTEFSTSTDGAGFYNFDTAPSLGAGESYYVRYTNNSDPSRLSYWGTRDILGYVSGGAVGAGNFDIANVSLLSPSSGAQVALPAQFQWALRPATPSDSYQFSLFDPNGSAFGQTGLLGYVNEANVTSLPGGFQAGREYGWYIAVNSPDGGYGESYYYRRVTFNNVLAPSQPAGADGQAVLPAKTPLDGTKR
jgi:uncharacterized repeat protein (TIGR01451 family)